MRVKSAIACLGFLSGILIVPSRAVEAQAESIHVWRSGQTQVWRVDPLPTQGNTNSTPSLANAPGHFSSVAGMGNRPVRRLRHGTGPDSESRTAYFDGHLLVELADHVNPDLYFLNRGILSWRRLPQHDHVFSVDAGDPDSALQLARQLDHFPGVVRCEPALSRQRTRKALPNDPLFPRQWHLRNTGQLGGLPGVDIHSEAAWTQGRGNGVIVGIVDDGLQINHPDLAPNASDLPGWDWNDDDGDPSPGDLDVDIHGTQVAGLTAARGDNGIGVSGVAPLARLVGLRLIGGPSTDATEAEAMLFRNDRIAIKNCSWGAPDGTGLLEGVGPLASAALAKAAEEGRGGLGTLLVFAAGNGRGVGDNANYDGFANSPYTIAVGTVNHRGAQTTYGESGACLVVSAPSGSSGMPRLTTTDLAGFDGADSGDYTTNFTGSSASAPLVSGVLALMIEANPQLGWRDAQEILMRSAALNDPTDTDWITNRAGFHFNHKYGAGLVDAAAAVSLSSHWSALGSREHVSVEWTDLGLTLPDNKESGVTVTLPVPARRFRVEHATLQTRLTHDDWGDLEIVLQSPSGTASRLAEPHSPVFETAVDWTFLSMRHWGEDAQGDWQVRIADRRFLNRGSLSGLKLELFGTQIPPVAPVLSGRWVSGGFELTILGEAGETYVVQRSAGMDSWESVVTLKASSASTLYVDPDPPQARRFYRVLSP